MSTTIVVFVRVCAGLERGPSVRSPTLFLSLDRPLAAKSAARPRATGSLRPRFLPGNMSRRRLGLVAVLAIALLPASPIGATDADDDDLAPPSNARARRDGRTATDRGASASGGVPETDPASALATAKGGDRRVVQEVSFVLEHSLTVDPGDAANFEPAGVFHAKAHFSPGAGATAAEPGAEPDPDAEDARDPRGVAPGSAVRLSHLRLTRDDLGADFTSKFAAPWRRICRTACRSPPTRYTPARHERVVAFIPARCLAESGLQEHFVLHMDEKGNVIGMDYDPAGFECRPADAAVVALGRNPSFKTSASVRFYKTAPALDPDAPTDVRGHGGPAGKKEREARARRSSDPNGGDGTGRDGGAGKEKTFWQKNWMYIVPAMMLLSNLVAPPPEQSRPKRS